VLDVATRRAVGWSAGLAESTWTVADALRNAVEVGGIPALFYVDNGSGYCNHILNGPSIGILARLHTTITHSIAYNSQARGVIERSHQTIWTHGAKEFPTYMGAPMDPEAKQKVYKLTRDDIKRSGRSRLLMPWPEFLKWCQERVDAYNNRPHSSLPRVRDPLTGKLRHQTPNEAWQAAIDEGWKPITIDRAEADDLFRPYKRATVVRGEVRLFNNIYFSRDLEEYHGEKVIVGYDIHDASRVWIRDNTGRMICVAEFAANKRDYFQQTVVQLAAEERARGRIKRAQVKIDDAELELNPPALIEQQPSLTVPLRIVQPEPVAIPAAEPTSLRPMFDSDAAQYRWLLQHTDRWTDHDRTWIEDYRFSSEYADIFGDEGEMAARSGS
jgi:putative transposase